MGQISTATPGTTGRRPRRVVLYSHDTFGLGHLRRSRALASALTQSGTVGSAIILTGSPVAGRFTFPRAVDHVRLPGVKKLADGSYVSQNSGMDIEATTALRTGLIESTVTQYDPRIDDVVRITLSFSQLRDLEAALDLPEGIYQMRKSDVASGPATGS